jgi:hypothetical protein
VKVQLLVLPAASVTVKRFVVIPLGYVAPLVNPAIWFRVEPGQLSAKEGVAYVGLAVQTPASVKVLIFGGQEIVGFSASETVTVKEQVLVLLDASMTLKVLVVTPLGYVAPLASPTICEAVDPTQLSPKVGALYVTTAEQVPAAVLTLILAGQLMVGFWLSTTVTVNEQVLVLPTASVTRKMLVVIPTGYNAPDVSPLV